MLSMTPLALAGSVYLLSHVSASPCVGCVLTRCLTPFIGYMRGFFYCLGFCFLWVFFYIFNEKKKPPKSMRHSVRSRKTTNARAATSGAEIDFHCNTFLLSQPQELQRWRSGHGKSASVAATTGNGLTFSLHFTLQTPAHVVPLLCVCVCVCKAGVLVCKCCFVCVYVCVIRDGNWIRDGSVAAVR